MANRVQLFSTCSPPPVRSVSPKIAAPDHPARVSPLPARTARLGPAVDASVDGASVAEALGCIAPALWSFGSACIASMGKAGRNGRLPAIAEVQCNNGHLAIEDAVLNISDPDAAALLRLRSNLRIEGRHVACKSTRPGGVIREL